MLSSMSFVPRIVYLLSICLFISFSFVCVPFMIIIVILMGNGYLEFADHHSSASPLHCQTPTRKGAPPIHVHGMYSVVSGPLDVLAKFATVVNRQHFDDEVQFPPRRALS